MAAEPPTHPSPMDLVEIIRVFGLLPDEERRSSMFGHFELMPPDHPFPLSRPIAVDLWLPKVFADAAHIYWISHHQARRSEQADTWASAQQSDREIAALEYLYGQWLKASALGKQLDENEAMVRLGLKSHFGLYAALNEFGYPHIRGQQLSECAIEVLSHVREAARTRTEAAKKQRQRRRKSSVSDDDAGDPSQPPDNPWSLSLPFMRKGMLHQRIAALGLKVGMWIKAVEHRFRETGRDNSKKSHRD